MKQKICIILLILAESTVLTGQSATKPAPDDKNLHAHWLKEANTYLQEKVQANEFSGSVLIARDGAVLLSKGYSWANREHDIRNTPQTIFRLGSLTKQFTAMTVLILQGKGKLQVGDSIRDYIPDCPKAWHEITIHHLLTHTSGIPSFTSFPDNLQHERLPATTAQTVERFRGKALEFKPGARYKYSNSGYVLLGYIIEQVTGESFEHVISRLIFRPLNMHNTGYDHPGTILKNRAAGYSRREEQLVNSIHFEMDTPHAAGALHSTVEDLLRWDQALYSTQLVSRKSLKTMFTPFKGGYAYGWSVGTFAKRETYSHGGGISGFNTYIMRFPEDKICIEVLSNFEFANSGEIAHKLATIVFDGINR